ncbi:MAG: hypothetical protein AB8B74_00560 [Crocinitomicaceae bacterium]
MRYILILIVFNFAYVYSADFDIKRMRELLELVDENEKSYLELEKLTEGSTHHQPIAFGYRGLYYFMKAKYVSWPNQKLAAFNIGKQIIEALITLNPKEPELRLIRYCIQYHAPAILGYNSNLKSDKKVMHDAQNKSEYKAIHYLLNGVLTLYP